MPRRLPNSPRLTRRPVFGWGVVLLAWGAAVAGAYIFGRMMFAPEGLWEFTAGRVTLAVVGLIGVGLGGRAAYRIGFNDFGLGRGIGIALAVAAMLAGFDCLYAAAIGSPLYQTTTGRVIALVIVLGVVFVVGHALLRLALRGSWTIIAVAREVLAEAIRMKLAIAFMVLLAVMLGVLPFATAGTLSERIQQCLTYSLSGSGLVLGLLTIFIACSTLSGEIREKQIFTVMTKPVARGRYLVGKWLGIVLLDALLLGVAAVAIYLVTVFYLADQPRAQGENPRVVYEQVLTARRAAPPDAPGMTAETAGQWLDQYLADYAAPAQATAVVDDLGGRAAIERRLVRSGAIERQAMQYLQNTIQSTAEQHASEQFQRLGWVQEQMPEFREQARQSLLTVPAPAPTTAGEDDQQQALVAGRRTFVFTDLDAAVDQVRPSPENLERMVDAQLQNLREQLGDQAGPFIESRGGEQAVRQRIAENLEQRGFNRTVQLRYELTTVGPRPERGARVMWVTNGRPLPRFVTQVPGGGRFERQHHVPIEQTLTEEIPLAYIRDGRLELTLANYTLHQRQTEDGRTDFKRVPLKFDEGGIELLYTVDSFGPNFARGALIMWVRLMFLAALGLTAATFLGFPVALLLSLMIYAGATLSGFFMESIDRYASLERHDLGLFKMAVGYIVRGFIYPLQQYSEYRAVPRLNDGVYIPWAMVAGAAVWIGVIWTGLTLAIGWLVFRRRELAKVQV